MLCGKSTFLYRWDCICVLLIIFSGNIGQIQGTCTYHLFNVTHCMNCKITLSMAYTRVCYIHLYDSHDRYERGNLPNPV